VQDPLFSEPYVDLDEWRASPVEHRYVHGGFRHTDTRFSFYFPPADQYEGRFYHYVTPVPASENLSRGLQGEEDRIGFALASGAYFVETNGGGRAATATPGSDVDPTIAAYRANAAAAQYSRVIATNLYGERRHYGYAFGGSGGAYRTIGGIENTSGIWDGAVPFVLGSPMALPNVFSVRMYAMRVLGEKLAAIADAVDVGSNADPWAGLDDEQRAALTEVTKMGFPLPAWHTWRRLGMHAFALIYPGVRAADPAYFEEFWQRPGYEGYAPTPSLQRALVRHRTTIRDLITAAEAAAIGLNAAWPVGTPGGRADDAWQGAQRSGRGELPAAIQLASLPEGDVLGADLIFLTGDAVGNRLAMTRMQGDIFFPGPDSHAFIDRVKNGDEVQIDNASWLAAQTYHRHQVPGPEYAVWDQFRAADGTPRYPQRPTLLGPLFAEAAAGTLPTGRFEGKMILVQNLYDTEAFPWQGDWYRARVEEHLGAETDSCFRLWYTDHADHGDYTRQKDPSHTVSYLGLLQQALRDLSAWVERDIPPPGGTRYRVVDGQVEVPASAAEREGIQPVVTLTADGTARAEVAANQVVTLQAVVEVPPGTGSLVYAEWDFGDGRWFPRPVDLASVESIGERSTLTTTCRFSAPGTYFAIVRVASQRSGDTETPFTRVQNLARVRIVVQ
jgi:hypothetical protein